MVHTTLGAIHWPQIHLSGPEELELKPMLKSFTCVYELPVVSSVFRLMRLKKQVFTQAAPL